MELGISEIILIDKEQINSTKFSLLKDNMDNQQSTEKLANIPVFKDYKLNNEENILKNVSKINIFIGVNNSGKSRFLRELFKKQLYFYSNQVKIEVLNEIIKEFKEEIKALFTKYGETFKDNNSNLNYRPNLNHIGKIDLEKVNKNTLNLRSVERLTSNIDYLKEINELINSLEDGRNFNVNLSKIIKGKVLSEDLNSGSKPNEDANIQKTIYVELEELADKYKGKIKSYEGITFDFKKVYIPTLRGIRNILHSDDPNEDIYSDRTKNDYFRDGIPEECEIFTGLTLYEDVKKLLLGDLKERKYIREFEEFLSREFFENKEVALIPKYNEKNLWIKIGDEEQCIFNLGDGIQSIIILTFPLFKYRDKSLLLFIEEPELFIHPGLQRKYIETINSNNFNRCQVFFTTHSNHFLDMTLDVSNIAIYQFNKITALLNENLGNESKFLIQNIDNPSISILNELGVKNSSIFLSNCTIWVEGITDRFYIRKYLSVYQKEMFKEEKIDKIFDEDIHYSFVEYSGGNITHWSFLDDEEIEVNEITKNINEKTICNRIFLIADSDGYDKEEKEEYSKAKRLDKLTQYFKANFYCMKCKEIENMLIPDTIKKVVNRFKDGRVSKNSDKDKDGEIFEKCGFLQQDYIDKNLGLFIDNKIDEHINKSQEYNGYRRKKNFAKGNTIKNKKTFCEYAIEEIQTLADMSEETVELCEKIYAFIKKSNK